jgi:hypothetical protein
MWVIAARMHMDGKAKEWFEAYKLRKVVGAWPEFIGDVEGHFAVGDLTSTTILGVATHPSEAVHAGGDISLETPTRCSPEPWDTIDTLVVIVSRVQGFFSSSCARP